MAGKSLILTYLFWAVGGWFGLHHFYLGRDRQAFVWWCLLAGYGGVGWFGDMFSIPKYVEEANYSPGFVQWLTEKMKRSPTPRFSMYRFIGSIAMGNLLSWLIFRGIPDEETVFGVSLTWLRFLIPIGSALGVHTVGNIGREEGGFLLPLLAAYLPYLVYSFHDPPLYTSTICAAVAFRWAVRWNRKPPKKTHVCKRAAILLACACLYLSLWTSYFYFNVTFTDEHGEEIKFRDSVKNLFQSPLWKDIVRSFKNLWTHYKHHGAHQFWEEMVKSLDPTGESNALDVLELPKTATQDEITKRWREFSKKYHPDKFSDPEEKLQAQEKFMKIKEAYETISVLHTKRKSRRSRMA